MVHRLEADSPGFEAAFVSLISAKRESEEDVDAAVAEILANVHSRCDAALIEYTARFDQHALSPDTMRVTPAEVEAAAAACRPEEVAALELAAERIEDYHRRQLPKGHEYVDTAGVRLGFRWQPIKSIGIYVPGGRAAYPSSVLMTAVPAAVAGVHRTVLVVPAPGGALNPLVLAATGIAGVDEVFRVGGAQAIAALAYGTETIAAVDKIFGPGNAYVAAAKRQVFGTVGIDLIAGPSEILIVADAANDPAWIAADLLSQAEHDPLAQAILITDDADFAGAVALAAETHLRQLPRAEIARTSWDNHGAIIVLEDLDRAPDLVDRIAPEHLELAVDDPERLAARVGNVGAIFLGRYTPEAIGDYVAGPSHVLPTSRSARFSSGLGVLDFMKRSSLISCDTKSIEAIGPAAVTLARAEGLDAHALSVSIRLDRDR